MKMVKVIGTILTTVLLLSIAFVGCGPEEPPPHEEVTLEIYATPMGTPAYIIALGLSELLKERHPWLRASVLEGGAEENIITTDELPPERRGRALIMQLHHSERFKAMNGWKPYTREYTDLKIVNGLINQGFTFWSFNPDIRSMQDLAGKKIAANPPPMAPMRIFDAVMDAWDLRDKVEVSGHRPTDLKDMLMTGVADVAYPTSCQQGKGGTFLVPPYMREAFATKPTYWVTPTQEDVDKINALYSAGKSAVETKLMEVPKGVVDGENPLHDTAVLLMPTSTMCWDTADPELIYEYVKFLAENADEFSKRGRNMRFSLEFMASSQGHTEALMHPGALRYYKEKGVEILPYVPPEK